MKTESRYKNKLTAESCFHLHKILDSVCGFKKEFSPNRYLDVIECDTKVAYLKEDMNNLILDFIAAPPHSRKEYIHDMSVWHSIYHRNNIDIYHIRFVSERDYTSEDIPFQIDFFTHSEKVVFIPDLLYNYCYNQGSLTKSFTINKFYKIKDLYQLLFERSKQADKDGMRAKRLFIGHIRTMIRSISNLPLTKSERINYIRTIINDEIWYELKKVYKPSFLPLHQRIMAILIYHRKAKTAYYYAKIMNAKILTFVKQLRN